MKAFYGFYVTPKILHNNKHIFYHSERQVRPQHAAGQTRTADGVELQTRLASLEARAANAMLGGRRQARSMDHRCRVTREACFYELAGNPGGAGLSRTVKSRLATDLVHRAG